ncbi:MAG TPA: NUDIX domain-containing protein [Blastocatellia bacterium]|nr:NUDIX domain-containing protein [Blastocatellia bacterium]
MSKVITEDQTSAGGVAYRRKGEAIEIAIISVGEHNRWQLPKGLIDKNETSAEAALREVREEAGIETEMIDLIDKVEYWYYAKRGVKRIRFHKSVYFYLLKYRSGDTKDHDREVNEARWVDIDTGLSMLTFKSEKNMVIKAKEMIKSSG